MGAFLDHRVARRPSYSPQNASFVSSSKMIITIGILIARRLLAALLILLVVSALLFAYCACFPSILRRCRCRRPQRLRKSRQNGTKWASICRYLGNIGSGSRTRFVVILVAPFSFVALPDLCVANALPATIELAVSAMVLAGILGVGGASLFRMRGTIFETIADMISILLLSIPEFLWGLILLFVFGVTLRLLPFTGQVSPDLPVPHITGFLLLNWLLVGRPDVFLSACQHLNSSCCRARIGVLANHHACLALQLIRCLSRRLHPAGASARILRRTSPSPPCVQERIAADADPCRRTIRNFVQRYASRRSDHLIPAWAT